MAYEFDFGAVMLSFWKVLFGRFDLGVLVWVVSFGVKVTSKNEVDVKI